MLTQYPSLACALLVVVGCAVATMGSFSGLGGALLLTPILAIGFGLPYHTAIGCTVAQTIGMSAIAVFRHYRLGHMDWPLAGNFIVGSVPGAILGRLTLHRLNEAYGAAPWLRVAFNVFYLSVLIAGAAVIAARVLKSQGGPAAQAAPAERAARLGVSMIRLPVVWMAGALAGGLAGLLAIGGGLVAVPVLSGLLAVPITTAVGTSILQMVFTTTAATLVSMGTTDLDARVIGCLLLGAVPGATAGPWLLHRVAGRAA
jgi:uncharacterized protein